MGARLLRDVEPMEVEVCVVDFSIGRRVRNHRITGHGVVAAAVAVVLFAIGCQKTETPDGNSRRSVDRVESTEPAAEQWTALLAGLRKTGATRVESSLAVGDLQLAQLASMPQLTEVDLPRAAASDGGLAALAELPLLASIVLGDTTITDDGLAKLADRKALRQLNLNDSRVTDRGLEQLSALPQLELLRLGHSQVTDEGLAAVGQISTLRYLILQNARITGRGFKYLHGLKQLESLYLHGNPLTGEGEAQLRKALPNLHPDW
jgi:hypothetical protein